MTVKSQTQNPEGLVCSFIEQCLCSRLKGPSWFPALRNKTETFRGRKEKMGMGVGGGVGRELEGQWELLGLRLGDCTWGSYLQVWKWGREFSVRFRDKQES